MVCNKLTITIVRCFVSIFGLLYCTNEISTIFRAEGEINVEEECPQKVGDLKSQHIDFLLESAVEHPSKKFVIFVDAVNQFHPGNYR